MKTDLQGRVRNTKLPQTRPLLPLFEAVINSMQAIAESPRRAEGHITIVVKRHGQAELELGDAADAPVSSFEVGDNGIGFNEANYESFQTSDSSLKISQGGKGIGRFLWLKAFDSVSVDSTFEEHGERYRRLFKFVLRGEGIEDERVEQPPSGSPIATRVLLDGFKEAFRSECPKRLRTMGQRIVEHCLSYFIHERCPRVVLADDKDSISLNELYVEMFHRGSVEDTFELAGRTFRVLHLRLYSADESQHRLHYCAHKREVVSDNLAAHVPNLVTRLIDEEGKLFFWSAFASGTYLDENVSPERQEFTFARDREDDLFAGEVTMREIREAALPLVASRLVPYLAPVQEQKAERIRAFVEQRAPEYRAVLRHRPQVLERLAPNLTEKQLDVELHRARRDMEVEVREQSVALISAEEPLSEDVDRYIRQVTDLCQADLVKYVIDRRAILELLERTLSRQATGEYELEDKIHKLVFPLRATSDEVDRHNLWIIDERLAYHTYLASDLPLRAQRPIETNSKDRPDVIVFDAPIALSEGQPPFGSIHILEFKRPMRKGYDEDDNPVSQVLRYIREVRDGRARDRAGRPMEIRGDVPFYCYVLCDLTQKIRQIAQDMDFTPAPDGMGFFTYNKAHTAYIEIISYNKMVTDAKRRNRAFFDKLNIPML